MTGDQDDFVTRLRAVLPSSWFPDDGSDTVLQGMLSGIGSMLAGVWSLLTYVRAQTRLSTATEGNLDIAAQDFTGTAVVRTAGETDDHLRARILRATLRERDTQAAIESVLRELTGYTPTVFLPGRASDAAHYGPDADTQVAAYDEQGAYGSRRLPYQCLVTAYRDDPVATPDDDIRDALLSVVSAAEVVWLRVDYPQSSNVDTLDDDFILDESLLS